MEEFSMLCLFAEIVIYIEIRLFNSPLLTCFFCKKIFSQEFW